MILLLSALYIFTGCLLVGAVSLMILLLSWLTDNIETDKRTCSSCYYNIDGKCQTLYEKECRKYEHFLWEIKEPPAVKPAHKVVRK